MFTGIVEQVGSVEAIEARGNDRSFRIQASAEFIASLTIGDSVAVDGACLTVTGTVDACFSVDVIGSTIKRTRTGSYTRGTRVNLERALRVGDRLDGHFLQGHVDGLGSLLALSEDSQTRYLEFAVPSDVYQITVPRGSIAINGVSLTVADLLPDDRCRVGIIPHTWDHTNLGTLTLGDSVNVEGDLIGKHVGRMLAPQLDGS